MMNYTSAMGSFVHQTVSLIMAAKSFDVIIGQPTTETMNKMVEQMAQMVAPIKTTAWGDRHGSLTLVLDNSNYSSITKACITSTMPVIQLDAINKGIMATSTPLKISPSKKKHRNFNKNLTCRRWSPTLVSNASLTASKNSMSKISTKSTSGTPTTPSKVFSAISEPTDARS
jgi:hypothetical protein